MSQSRAHDSASRRAGHGTFGTFAGIPQRRRGRLAESGRYFFSQGREGDKQQAARAFEEP